MSSMCYPSVLQAEIDEFCDSVGRSRISFCPERAEEALREVMSGPRGDRSTDPLRRSVIARLFYYARRGTA